MTLSVLIDFYSFILYWDCKAVLVCFLSSSVFSPATQSTTVSHQQNGLKHAQQQLL